MNLSAPFIKRPIATSLLMLAIFLSGVLAFQLLPVSSLPEVEYPTIQVATFYPGASPDVVASSISAPLEKQFGQMPGLNLMTSQSGSDASVITLQFTLDMSLDIAEQEVQAAINAAGNFLPKGLPYPPIYNKVNPADTPIITLGLTAKTLSLPQIEDYADTRLAPKIAEQPGVGLVSITGGQRPGVRIQADPNQLAAYGLSLETIRNAVTTANVNAAKGSFDGPTLSYTINSNDQLLSSSDYKPLIITYKNNAPVRLENVANVIDGAENVYQAAWMNTTPAIILNIQRQPGANVIKVADTIKGLLTKMQAAMPAALYVTMLSDRTTTIRASVKEVQFDLIFSIALVVMVIFIFLRHVPATLIPSIAVPLSLIGTFGMMYLLGFSLNNLTLMSLTIATGFVADDAIVMIENISRHIETGEAPFDAAYKGAKEIGFTILSLTVSLIAVLIPLLFMQDIVGRLFREFALTLAIAILISAFISLTLTPMLCARLLHRHGRKTMGSLERKAIDFQDRVITRYGLALRWVLSHQPLTLAIAILTLLVTLSMFYIVPKGFFPIQDTGLIQGITQASPMISFTAMADRQQALAKVVLSDPDVSNLSSFIGIDGTTNMTENTGRMLITLKPLSERSATASEIIRRLQSKLVDVPGATLFMQPVQDLNVDTKISPTQFQYNLSGANADEVANWSKQLYQKLKQSPLLQDVAIDQNNVGLQTYIAINRDTAARLGITMQMIDDMLYDAFGQRQISTIFTERNQYHVILEALPSLANTPNALNNIYLNSPITGAAIPLLTFAKVTQTLGPLIIYRQDQFPVATLSFNLAPYVALGEATNVVNAAKNSLGIPESIQTNFAGAAQTFQNSLANEGWLVLAAIIVVYIVLGVLYESYIHPITILSTLPSAGMGALLALMLTRNDLSVIALIGVILLIGIVMKNAIMMIDFALEQERVHFKSPPEAIYQAALLRFRPILMTTLASLLGAVPLAIGTGMGSELRQPLGITIIGGLIVSQLLTLFTTPVIYLAFDRLSKRMHQRIIQRTEL